MLCATLWQTRHLFGFTRSAPTYTPSACVVIFAKKEYVKFHLSKIGLTLEGICSFYFFLFNKNWVTDNNNLRGPGLRNLSKNDHQRLSSEVYGTCGKSARSDS